MAARARITCLFLFALLANGCDEANDNLQRKADQRDCSHSENDPLAGILACTRLLNALDDRLMKESTAYYNRGLAFAAIGEWRHAQVDYERVLALNPSDKFAKMRLDEMKEDER